MYRILTSPLCFPRPRCRFGLLSAREEHGLWVSENRVLRGVMGWQREEVTVGQGKCVMGSFMGVLFAEGS
jgi:hypothetical protein